MLARTPPPPYYAVIFCSVRSADDTQGYAAASDRMMELAAIQPGFLGVDSARETLGITVSYWRSLADIAAWRAHAEHTEVRRMGRERWYSAFELRVARVERACSFGDQGTGAA